MQNSKWVDVAIVGAGLAGITCGQTLRQSGYTVAILEKSRGLGGRVATRRLMATCADHGAKFVEPQGEQTQQLIQQLCDRQLLQPWTAPIWTVDAAGTLTPTEPTPRYVAPEGMTAIAKVLAEGLDIRRQQRVVEIKSIDAQTWEFTTDSGEALPLQARSLVLAIPAPQAVPLLEPLVAKGLPTAVLETVRKAMFDPCITAIATYPAEQAAAWHRVGALQPLQHPVLRWVSRESQKRSMPGHEVCVLHSTPAFATQYIDAPTLETAGRAMLQAGAAWFPGMEKPQQLQLHRWRYGFARSPDPMLEPLPHAKTPIPLVITGDWCRGSNLESAVEAGVRAASLLEQWLNSGHD
ncbi:NAD(P)/FAD-dependent oxidoreductase [Vacuolonema iberomarrocanum]|uniref:NAD(P)/FAD-dependent oxidoreductase n=1 Tax=Vacuolonema iberomarrocanum TaxID=3454632 RepID=UPI0019F20A46|nr:FAD-dependent oxidoreductase [filamentous cyanobacterium LEGE 07170]